MITVKNVLIGEGRPKICVPITGRTLEELNVQSLAIKDSVADLAELRIDYFVKENGIEDIGKAIAEIKKNIGNMPLIFTFRTKQEGGECAISVEEYEKLIIDVAKNQLADIIDVEYNLGEIFSEKMCSRLKELGIAVILSNHDFERTISEQELIDRMCKMSKLGADIVKIAMMPVSKKDVINLISATVKACDIINTPVITMSMGSLGAISRLCGEFMGSAVTFATVGEASAPGQMSAIDVKDCLELIHRQF